MSNRFLGLALACALATVMAIGVAAHPSPAPPPPYEVWITDQSATDATDRDGDGNKADGGYLYVFDGKPRGGIKQKPAQLDFATLFRNGLKRNPDGTSSPFAYPVGQRPHIVAFNVESTHAMVSFLGKNLAPVFLPGPDTLPGTSDDVRNNDFDAGVAILRVESKKVIAFFNNLNGLHMPGPSPDSSMWSGVSIPQKRLHVMTTDYVNETFTLLDPDGAGPLTDRDGFDLTKMRQDSNLTTPENDPGGPLLPDLLNPVVPKPANNARPFCSNFTPDSRFVFITFERGGIAIVELKSLPDELTGAVTVHNPPILREVYSEAEVPGEGCGLLQHFDGTRMYTNGASKLIDQEFVYVWSMTNMGNGVKDDLLTSIPLNPSGRGDSHGPMFTENGKYLWLAMRLDSEIKVIDTDLNQVINTMSVDRGGECGTGDDGDGEDDAEDEDGDDCLTGLTPDVLDTNPDNTLMFVSLRGYCPTTAINSYVDEDVHRVCPTPTTVDPVTGLNKVQSDGRRPGMAVFKINRNGTRGPLVKIYKFKNPQPNTDPANNGTLDVVDPHGVRVVSRSGLLGG